MAQSSEFVSEAQELIEDLSGYLWEIEGQLSHGDECDPSIINGAFRAVHTLKGLSAMSGVNQMRDFRARRRSRGRARARRVAPAC